MVVMSGLCRNSEYFSKVSCLVDPLSLITFEDMFFPLTREENEIWGIKKEHKLEG